MALKDSLTELLTPAVENAGFFLEEVQIQKAGITARLSVLLMD